MSRVLKLRGLLVAALVALAVLASWLIPRVTTPPERFTVAMQLIDDGRAAEAIYLLEDEAWRGVAEYRAGRFRRALYAFIKGEGAEDLYNVGNAYARLHSWGGAKSAYVKALRLDPDHADAKFNLELIERAAAAEKRLEEEKRDTSKAGRWQDGDRRDDERGGEPGSKVEQGPVEEGAMKPSDQQNGRAGTADTLGRLGEESTATDRKSGIAGGDPNGAPPEGMKAVAGRALIRKESAQAAEVLLRRIRDNPSLVLRARLRAAHKAREKAEGACEGC